MPDAVSRDLKAIARIEAVPTILRTIRESTGLGCAFIARVRSGAWVACAVQDHIDLGVRVGGDLDVADALCNWVRETHQPIIVDHASQGPPNRFKATLSKHGVESYIGVPIFRSNGDYFGTLCGLDRVPQALSDGRALATLELFSELISRQLEAEARHEDSRDELTREREASKLREEFVAVLGHDLRNPLSSIKTGTEMLLYRTVGDAERRTLERILSSSNRIAELVDDLLDLTRGRLGGGILLDVGDVGDLGARLGHVVDEVRAANPERAIDWSSSLGPVFCDERRIEQLLSNLLTNAIEHGAPGTSICVSARGTDGSLEIKVENQGDPIPEDVRDRLFHPYFRIHKSGRRQGLGLGLYIAREIAKSHGGTLELESSASGTVFTFTMQRPFDYGST
jgi:signal transduction histidine kinase